MPKVTCESREEEVGLNVYEDHKCQVISYFNSANLPPNIQILDDTAWLNKLTEALQ